jgi:protein required for attachment to host cells
MSNGGTWILVADGSRAQLYLQGEDSNGRDWKLLQEFDHPAAREMGHDLRGNRPDQIQHQMDIGYKGTVGPHNVQEHEASKFAKELCEFLHGAAMRNQFSTLVVAAAPKTLGALRNMMSKSVSERVSHYLSKDYTDKNPRELAPLMMGL